MRSPNHINFLNLPTLHLFAQHRKPQPTLCYGQFAQQGKPYGRLLQRREPPQRTDLPHATVLAFASLRDIILFSPPRDRPSHPMLPSVVFRVAKTKKQ
jgi:hypothetical protein